MVRSGTAAAAVILGLTVGAPAWAGASDCAAIAEIGEAGLAATALGMTTAKDRRPAAAPSWRVDSTTPYGLGYALRPAARPAMVLAAPGRSRDRYSAGFGREPVAAEPARPESPDWFSGMSDATTLDGLSLKVTRPDNAVVRELPWAKRHGVRLSVTAQF